jgi:predicted transcriptional regulator
MLANEIDILVAEPMDLDEFLMHVGVGHLDGGHSGRYPWGSGENGFQRYGTFYDEYNKYKKDGYSEKEIAEKMCVFDRWGNPNINMLRAKYRNAKTERRIVLRERALELQAQGLGATEIGRQMGGISESSVRSLLDEGKAARNDRCRITSEALKSYVDENRYVDIGAGAEIQLGTTRSTFDTAVAMLKEDGYQQHTLYIDQMGTDHKTPMTVLCSPDVTFGELSENRFNVKPIIGSDRSLTPDKEVGKLGLTLPVASVDSKRIMVRYHDDPEGGVLKDGNCEIRPGLEDISLGASNYMQVRIPIDGTHYFKGTAVYNNNMPDGIDIIVNSNKPKGTPLKGSGDNTVFKLMKGLDKKTFEGTPDDNPFGASVTEMHYTGKDGKDHISSVYRVNEEGVWEGWSRSLSPQMLSKQPAALAKRQLDIQYNDRKQELEEIMALTNPTIKKKLLILHAEKCDKNAIDLKAAPFPGQQSYVLIPDIRLKDDEVYAPKYKDGQVLALVRYPHGSISEIPILRVRNTGSPAKDILGNTAPDAIAINHTVAQRLSGADFDGDTVIAIPLNAKVNISSRPQLRGLIGFDPQEKYPGYPGMKVLSKQRTQIEMGIVTNLITDMTLKGAKDDEIAAAIRHSMVVIDANKHELNYKKSEIDNHIAELKQKYQGGGGASTIISRAKSPTDIPLYKDWRPTKKSIDPVTGEKILKPVKESEAFYRKGKLKGLTKKEGGEVTVLTDKKTGQLYYIRKDPETGKSVRVYATKDDFSSIITKERRGETSKMAKERDPYKLTSGGSKENPGYLMEGIYAKFATDMKALGNKARLEWLKTGNLEYHPEAKKQYAEEVASLERKLLKAKSNAPFERQAQLLANRTMAQRRKDNPNMTAEEEAKYRGQAINAARAIVGASKENINITDREWAAIQAGAISESKLNAILDNADLDVLRERATPRATKTITPTMESLAKSMAKGGYTSQQIADRLGISTSSIYTILKG